MFRAHVLRRSFSLWNRVPTSQLVRSAQRDGLETIHVQRVRIKKPLLSRRRLLKALIVWSAFYGLVRWLDDEDEDEEAEEVENKNRRTQLRRIANQVDVESDGKDAMGPVDHGTTDEEDEDEEGEAVLFLPTGFSRPKAKTFWKGSDPEWQEFRKIAQDKERVLRIRAELTSTVRDVVGRHPHFKRALGTVDAKKGRVWLEVLFPDGPPPEFERPGIEITEDLEVRSTTRPVHMVTHQRLERLLVPLPVAHSLYVDGKTRAWRSWQDFRTYIGWESDIEKRLNVKRKRDALGILATPGLPSSPTSPGTSSSPASDAKSTANDAPKQPVSPTSSPQQEPATQGEQNAASHRFLPSLPTVGSMTLNLSVFHQTFRRQYKGPPKDIPRGALQVSGLIEVIGAKGKLDIDVRAIYDPKDGKYKSVDLTPRHFKEYRQRPRGGP